MRTQAIACALTTVAACCLAPLAKGAIVDAGTITTVTVEASSYDTSLSDAGGCGLAGCSADLTRDGDSTSPESRWSCKGDSCSLKLSLTDPAFVTGIKIALHKGDTRTRDFAINVDNQEFYEWTSSGTTSSFETIDFNAAPTRVIEIRCLMSSSEWISILEVEVLADNTLVFDVVEAGTMRTVTASSDVAYSSACSPDGCSPSLTRDGDMSSDSRWSCKSTDSYESCPITFDLGATYELDSIRLALHKGDERVRSGTVYVDGELTWTWESSGTTSNFESFGGLGSSGRVIEIYSTMDEGEWLSIIEVEIMVLLQYDC